MKPRKLLLLSILLATTLGIAAFNSACGPQTRQISADKGFAVVELYTSEGCSSCPPADQLVGRVQKEYDGRPVYILAMHVDYWDRLGWKDAFSNAAYTERQRQYANWLHLQSVYTPQIIVNGQKEFVGSQSSTLHSAIENDLKTNGAAAHLTIDGLRQAGRQLEWTWQTENIKKGLSLVVALVQRSATTDVKAGENSGRTLSHVQIVRNLQTTALNGKTQGTGHLDWPTGVKPGDMEVIAFLQDTNSGEIVAATAKPTI